MTQSRRTYVKRGTRQRWLAENEGKHFCHCGCGGVIPLRVEHFNSGVPSYLHGHNQKVRPSRQRKVPLISVPCGCGCGVMTTPGRKFISGHNNVGQKRSVETRRKLSVGKLGERNPNYGKIGAQSPSWRGGRLKHDNGYILVHAPDHPFAVKRYVMEHRLVLEQHLCEHDADSSLLVEINGQRYLRPEYDVHHKDEVKDHNEVGNLEALLHGEHTRIHSPALIDARWPNRKEQS